MAWKWFTRRHQHWDTEKILVDLIVTVSVLVAAVLLFLCVINELVIDTVIKFTIIVEFVLSVNLTAPASEVEHHHLVLNKILNRHSQLALF